MPPRNTTAEVVARAGDKCVRLACAKHFPTVLIGDVAEVVSGGTPSTDRGDFWNGDVVWVTPKDLGRPRNVEVTSAERGITALGLEESSARLLPQGTVLLSSRAPIGHLGIAGRPLATNQGFKNIVCSQKLDNRFLFHVLRGSIDELISEGRGNTFLEIPGKVVKGFPIPLPPLSVQKASAEFLDALYLKVSGQQRELPALPAPLAEQRQIVSRIEELAAQINQARLLRQVAQGERQVLFTKVMNRLFEKTGGEMVKIGSEFRVTTGGTPARGNPAYWDGDVNWVSSGEVAFQRINRTKEKITKLGLQNSNARIYPPSTVLLAMIGQGKTRGQCAILECEAATNQNVAGIHVYETVHLPEYVYWWLFASYQRSRSVETGTAQPALSGERVKQIQLPLPPPAEQRRIVAELDKLHAEVDALKLLQAETAVELDAMLPAILDRAFKGEL